VLLTLFYLPGIIVDLERFGRLVDRAERLVGEGSRSSSMDRNSPTSTHADTHESPTGVDYTDRMSNDSSNFGEKEE
jgi:hypothetical protein